MISALFYSHHLWKYGTVEEENELARIEDYFGDDYFIINPATAIYCRYNMDNLDVMEQCFKLIGLCDILVFSTIEDGYIGKGVYTEIERALSLEKNVYYLLNYKFIPFTREDYNNIKKTFNETKTDKRYAKIKVANYLN